MRLSPLSRRFLRQSHFSATVWTGLNSRRRGNGFSVGGAKIQRLFGWGRKNGEKKQSRQRIQYVFFEKGIHVQWQSPRSWEIFENFCVKRITLQFARLLLTVSYRKQLGEQDGLVAPPIILLGEQLLPLLPRLPLLC